MKGDRIALRSVRLDRREWDRGQKPEEVRGIFHKALRGKEYPALEAGGACSPVQTVYLRVRERDEELPGEGRGAKAGIRHQRHVGGDEPAVKIIRA